MLKRVRRRTVLSIAGPNAGAQRLAGYRLRAYFLPLVGPCSAHLVTETDRIDLGTFLAGEIEFAIDPAARVIGLHIEPNRVMTLDPAEIEELDRRAGDPPVLRDLDLVRERLEFTPAVQRPKFDERGRPLADALSFVIRPELIRAVASAFAASAPRRSMNCDKPAIRVDNDPHAAISPARSAAARRSAAVTRRDARRLPGTPRS